MTVARELSLNMIDRWNTQCQAYSRTTIHLKVVKNIWYMTVARELSFDMIDRWHRQIVERQCSLKLRIKYWFMTVEREFSFDMIDRWHRQCQVGQKVVKNIWYMTVEREFSFGMIDHWHRQCQVDSKCCSSSRRGHYMSEPKQKNFIEDQCKVYRHRRYPLTACHKKLNSRKNKLFETNSGNICANVLLFAFLLLGSTFSRNIQRCY
jgi:hypothetical protein